MRTHLKKNLHSLVNAFQEDPDEKVKVAVLSICACGMGLTLTASSIVVFAELYWVRGNGVIVEIVVFCGSVLGEGIGGDIRNGIIVK
jgi:hypothetical protein